MQDLFYQDELIPRIVELQSRPLLRQLGLNSTDGTPFSFVHQMTQSMLDQIIKMPVVEMHLEIIVLPITTHTLFNQQTISAEKSPFLFSYKVLTPSVKYTNKKQRAISWPKTYYFPLQFIFDRKRCRKGCQFFLSTFQGI